LSQPAGFREYVAARQRSLVQMAWLLTGDWPAAEDLVQTALVRVWPRWDRVSRAGDPDAYVRRVVLNCFLSWRRRRWHGETPTAVPPERTSDDAGYGAADLRDALRRLLPALPPRQRAVVVLRYYQDMPEAEVAEMLGCRVGTVKSQAAKALRTLRTMVGVAGLEGTGHARG
jgi:RNA polymerase sigma-70 factor (sigma-E family)